MKKLLLCAISCITLFTSSYVFAGFGINPVVINFDKHNRSTSVEFKNNDDSYSTFQATPIRKTDKKDEKGNMIFERCDVVDVSPMKFDSKPGTAQDIRVKLKVKDGYTGDCMLSIAELSRKHRRKKENPKEGEDKEELVEEEKIEGSVTVFRGFNLPIKWTEK